MKELFKLELKKIVRSRLTLFVCLGSLGIIGILFSLSVAREIAVDEKGKQYMGKEAFDLQRSYDNKVAGSLSNENVKMAIASYQDLFSNPKNIIETAERVALKEEVFIEYIQPYYSYFKVINEAYIEPNTVDMSFATLEKVDLEDNYYSARKDKVNKILNQEYLDWNFSDTEKQFWSKKIDNISIPYEYGYCGGWKRFLASSELLVFTIISICICVAPVFAGEFQSHADSILLTSKYGKSKLITAKIFAAFVFSIIMFAIHVLIALGIQLIVAGSDGANLPIQLTNVICPYNLTMLSATALTIITAFIVLLGMVSITLFLSSKLANTFFTLIVDILLIMTPMFLSISETNGIWNRILMILPSVAVQPVLSDDFSAYFSYPIGIIFDINQIRIGVYIIIAIIFIPVTIKTFRKHQVC